MTRHLSVVLSAPPTGFGHRKRPHRLHPAGDLCGEHHRRHPTQTPHPPEVASAVPMTRRPKKAADPHASPRLPVCCKHKSRDCGYKNLPGRRVTGKAAVSHVRRDSPHWLRVAGQQHCPRLSTWHKPYKARSQEYRRRCPINGRALPVCVSSGTDYGVEAWRRELLQRRLSLSN